MNGKQMQTQEEFDECKKRIVAFLKEAKERLKMAKQECEKMPCAKLDNLVGKEIQEEIYRIQELEINYLKPLCQGGSC